MYYIDPETDTLFFRKESGNSFSIVFFWHLLEFELKKSWYQGGNMSKLLKYLLYAVICLGGYGSDLLEAMVRRSNRQSILKDVEIKQYAWNHHWKENSFPLWITLRAMCNTIYCGQKVWLYLGRTFWGLYCVWADK